MHFHLYILKLYLNNNVSWHVTSLDNVRVPVISYFKYLRAWKTLIYIGV